MKYSLSEDDIELIIEALSKLTGGYFAIGGLTSAQNLAISQRVEQIKAKLNNETK